MLVVIVVTLLLTLHQSTYFMMHVHVLKKVSSKNCRIWVNCVWMYMYEKLLLLDE